MEVYVFGDQTADVRSFLAKVFVRKELILLQTFLQRAAEAIRIEVGKRSQQTTTVPNFGTIQELVDRYYKLETPDPAIESALVALSQFAHYIGSVLPM